MTVLSFSIVNKQKKVAFIEVIKTNPFKTSQGIQKYHKNEQNVNIIQQFLLGVVFIHFKNIFLLLRKMIILKEDAFVYAKKLTLSI